MLPCLVIPLSESSEACLFVLISYGWVLQESFGVFKNVDLLTQCLWFLHLLRHILMHLHICCSPAPPTSIGFGKSKQMHVITYTLFSCCIIILLLCHPPAYQWIQYAKSINKIYWLVIILLLRAPLSHQRIKCAKFIYKYTDLSLFCYYVPLHPIRESSVQSPSINILNNYQNGWAS